MLFIVVQNPGSGETLAEMETAVRETLDEFANREVSADDLQKFKAEYESDRVFGLQSVRGKVSTLAAFQTYTGSPAGIGDEIQRYLNVEIEDVNRTFKQYIAGKPAVILSVVPNGKLELAAAEQNFVAPERNIPESFGDEGSDLPLRPVVDNFDRSKTPVPGSNPAVELPAIWDVGQRDEPPGKAGLTSLMTSLIGEATLDHSAAEFTEELERIGANIGVRSGQYQTTVTVNTLTKHLDKAMALMLERMLKPALTEEDFDRIKSQTIEGLMASRKTAQGLAGRAITSVLLDDVKGYYAAHFPAHLSGITVSASLPQAEILSALEGFATLEVTEAYRIPIAALPEIKGRTLYLVNKEGRTGQLQPWRHL